MRDEYLKKFEILEKLKQEKLRRENGDYSESDDADDEMMEENGEDEEDEMMFEGEEGEEEDDEFVSEDEEAEGVDDGEEIPKLVPI